MNFWNAFRESVVMQGVLAVAIWGAIIYLAITNQPIPDLLATAGGAIIVFWYRTKSELMAEKAAAGQYGAGHE